MDGTMLHEAAQGWARAICYGRVRAFTHYCWARAVSEFSLGLGCLLWVAHGGTMMNEAAQGRAQAICYGRHRLATTFILEGCTIGYTHRYSGRLLEMPGL